MKTIVCLLFTSLLAFTSVLSQQYKTTLSPKSSYNLKLTDIEADLNITGSSENELIVRVSSLPEMPEKAKGLRPLTKTGVDNTGLGLNIEMIEDIISLSGGKSGENLKYEIDVPDNVSISINNPRYDRLYEIRLSDISNEIEIFISSGNINMANVTGPVIIRTDKGNVDISFSELNQEGPMSIICQNGDIDITVPEKEDATFKLSAGNGDIYTDLDLKETKGDFSSPGLYGYYVNPDNNKSYFKFDYYPFDKLNEIIIPDMGEIEKIEVDKDKGVLRFEKKKGNDKLIDLSKKYEVNPDHYYSAEKFYAKSMTYSHPFYFYDFFFYDFKGALNDGGVEIAVKTENGNIYLRKAKP
jgi:lia operon protein LiaG